MATTVAIWGSGSSGMQHFAAFNSVPDAKVFVYPKRSDRIPELQRQGVSTLENLDFLKKEHFTHAVIASDTKNHIADTYDALRNDLDVLVEKPFGVDSSSVLPAIERAQSLGRRLYLACCLRFSESLNVFKSWLPEVGPLHSIRIECQSYLPDWRPQRDYRESYSARKEEGGVLRDLIHEIDYAGWLFGWPTALQATLSSSNTLGIQAEEAADLFWKTKDGVPLSMRLDYVTRPPRRIMKAFGRNGTLTWDGIQGTVVFKAAGEGTKTHQSLQNKEALWSAQALAFVQSTQGKLDSRLATATEGAQALAVCDAARIASTEGRWVPVQKVAS